MVSVQPAAFGEDKTGQNDISLDISLLAPDNAADAISEVRMRITGKYRVIALAMLLMSVSLACAGVTLVVLYNSAFNQQRFRLAQAVSDYVSLMDAVAAFDRKMAVNIEDEQPGYDPFESTVAQLKDALKSHLRSRISGEFNLARRVNGNVVCLLENALPGPDDDSCCELWPDGPMQKALAGEKGTFVGKNPQGDAVLSAYDYAKALGVGIVVSIRLSEIRRPYIDAGLIIAAITLLLTVFGVFLSFKLGNPIVADLQRTESRLADITSSIPGVVYQFIRRTDGTSKMTYISESVADIFGIAPSTLLDDTSGLENFIHPDDYPAFLESSRLSAVNLAPWTRDFRVITPGNNIHWIRAVSNPRKLSDSTVQWNGVILDITKNIQVESALRESESKFRSYVSASPNGIFLIDNDGNCLEVNESASKLTGYSRDELLTINVSELHPEEEREMVRARIRQCRRAGSLSGEMTYLTKSGTLIHCQLNAVALDDDRILAFLVDTTESHNIRSQLQDSNERFLQLANNTSDMFWLADATDVSKLRFLYVNPAFERVWKCRAEDVYRNAGILSSSIHEVDRDFVAAQLSAFLAGKADFNIEYRIVWPDGTVRHLSDKAEAICDAAGRVVRVAGIIRDITALKNAAEERAYLESQLRHAQKMETIGNLAGGIAHDFNNILVPILGYAELLKSECAADATHLSDVTHIVNAANRARDLVRQILTFSRQQEKERIPILLHPIVKETLKLVRSSLPSHVSVVADIDEDCPPVMADPTQMHQVFMNLYTNAGYALRDSGGSLTVTVKHISASQDSYVAHHPELDADAYIRIDVRDTGHGMDAATLDRIFEPFFTTKPEGEGTGLGLSVVFGIIKSCDGAIRVQSKRGKGTAFTIYLPTADTQSQDTGNRDDVIPTGHERVLVVDDETENIAYFRRVLRKLGYSVISRPNATEAYELIRSHPRVCDLLLTDITMPRMNGYDLAGAVKSISPNLPIVFVTGYSENVSPQRARQVGVDEYVFKPIAIKELAVSIRRALDSAVTSDRAPQLKS